MVDNTFQNIFSLSLVQKEEWQNARLTVAGYSTGVEDCRYLLEALGLLYEPDKYY